MAGVKSIWQATQDARQFCNLFVLANSPASPDGSLRRPYRTIQAALDAIGDCPSSDFKDNVYMITVLPYYDVPLSPKYREDIVIPNGRQIFIYLLHVVVGDGATPGQIGNITWNPTIAGSFGEIPRLGLLSPLSQFDRFSTLGGWRVAGSLSIGGDRTCDLTLVGPGRIDGEWPADPATPSIDLRNRIGSEEVKLTNCVGITFWGPVGTNSGTSYLHQLSAQYSRFDRPLFLSRLGNMDMCAFAANCDIDIDLSMSGAVKPVGFNACSFDGAVTITSNVGALAVPFDDVSLRAFGLASGVLAGDAYADPMGHADRNLFAASVIVPDVTGGSEDGTCTVQARDSIGQILKRAIVGKVVVSDTQYAGSDDANANVTFSAETSGSILASGSGWCVFKTNATGEFACTVSNTVDETVYFSVVSSDGGQTGTGEACSILECVTDSAAWSA